MFALEAEFTSSVLQEPNWYSMTSELKESRSKSWHRRRRLVEMFLLKHNMRLLGGEISLVLSGTLGERHRRTEKVENCQSSPRRSFYLHHVCIKCPRSTMVIEIRNRDIGTVTWTLS